MHQHSTSGIREEEEEEDHVLTCGATRRCGLTSLVVCINKKICDIRERNVTIWIKIATMNICSLGYRNIRECLTLWRLVLRSLGCITTTTSILQHATDSIELLKFQNIRPSTSTC